MDEEQLFQDVAERLRTAHLRVAALSASVDEKFSVTRHLLAISEVSKRDLGKASLALDALLADLEARPRSCPGGS